MPDKVRVLFVGDVIGRPGRRALNLHLPTLVEKYSPSIIIGNGENAAGGIGMTEDVCRELFGKFDVITSGNHIWDKKEGLECLKREPRLLRPANYPDRNPGMGAYVCEVNGGIKVGVLNLQGRVFMEPLECPFRAADESLENLRMQTNVIIIDFHAEATSEKQALGWYLDGKVSAVIGTHTHVQTADEKILPEGTAYLTDVGMTGGYNSVIGMKKEQAIQRFLTSRPHRFEPAKGRLILSAVYLEIDIHSGRALRIKTENLIGNSSEE